METIDIYRTAKQYIDLYGLNAEVRAAIRYDDMMAADDHRGMKVWDAILTAIKELRGRVCDQTAH